MGGDPPRAGALRALDASHFAATKPRVNDRAIRAVRSAAEEEIRAVFGP